jgi:inosine-uridine nucleoside N-ribohydrolase
MRACFRNELAMFADNPTAAPKAVFIDTDTGVDDAMAITLLLRSRSVQVVGISTVVGNSSAEHAARNVLTLLTIAQHAVPVVIGAAAPLQLPPTGTGAFVHGPDGLWFAQQPHDLSGLSSDAPAAIAAAARTYPGLTILALGPLTNIAQALQRFPADLASVQIMALGGSKLAGGNSSPVAEFNIYADPHAAAIVLASKVNLTLVTLDAFQQVTFDQALLGQLSQSSDPLWQFLAHPVGGYIRAQQNGVEQPIALPDLVAAAIVLDPSIARPEPALIMVESEGRVRGQTIIATSMSERLTLLASDAELSGLASQLFSTPGFDLFAGLGGILQRQADNAKVVLAQHLDRQATTALINRLIG